MDEAKRSYYLYKQVPEDSKSSHLKNYCTNVDVVKNFGSKLFNDEALVKYEREKDIRKGKTIATNEEYENKNRER